MENELTYVAKNFGKWEDQDFITFCDWHLYETKRYEDECGFRDEYNKDSWITSLTEPIILELFIRLYGRENVENYDEFNVRILEEDFDSLPTNLEEWGDFELYIYTIVMERYLLKDKFKSKTFGQLLDNLESITGVIKEALGSD